MNNISALDLILKMAGGGKLLFQYLKEDNEVRLGTESLSGLCYVLSQAGMNVRLEKRRIPDLNDDKNICVTKAGYQFLVITGINDDNITCTQEKGTKTIQIDKFEHHFNGEVIVIPKDAKANIQDKPGFIQWLITVASPFLLIASVLIILGLKMGKIPEAKSFQGCYLFSYASGLMFSILLFSRQYGMLTKLTSSFCLKTGKGKKDCDSVLSSKGAILFGDISWSDIGIIYFFSMLLIALLFPFRANTLAYIISSLIAAPYVVYSLYYQARIVRSWCFMCLLIQFIFLYQLGLTVIYLCTSVPIFTFDNFWDICLAVSLVISAFLIFRKLLRSSVIYKYAAIRYEYMRFKDMPETLYSSLIVEPVLGDRIIVNPDAKNIITIVFNFLCAPCMHKISQILNILNKSDRAIGIEFAFFTRREELKSNISLLLYFISIYRQNQNAFLEELGRYARNYPVSRSHFSSKWDSMTEIDNYLRSVIVNHLTWGRKHQVIATPTFSHNNRFVKNDYSLHEFET